MIIVSSTVTGCLSTARTDNSALIEAAGAAGAKAGAEVRIDIGPLAEDCYKLIPYPPRINGESGQAQAKRWRLIVDEANRIHVIACVREQFEKLRRGLREG